MIHKRRYGTFVRSLDGDTETPTHARDLTDLNSFQLWRGGGKSLVTLQVSLSPVGCGWSFGKVFLAPASAAEPTRWVCECGFTQTCKVFSGDGANKVGSKK